MKRGKFIAHLICVMLLCLICRASLADPPANGRPQNYMNQLKDYLDRLAREFPDTWQGPCGRINPHTGGPLVLLDVHGSETPSLLHKHGPWGPFAHLHFNGSRPTNDIVFWWQRPYIGPSYNRTLWWRQHIPNASARPPQSFQNEVLQAVDEFINQNRPAGERMVIKECPDGASKLPRPARPNGANGIGRRQIAIPNVARPTFRSAPFGVLDILFEFSGAVRQQRELREQGIEVEYIDVLFNTWKKPWGYIEDRGMGPGGGLYIYGRYGPELAL